MFLSQNLIPDLQKVFNVFDEASSRKFCAFFSFAKFFSSEMMQKVLVNFVKYILYFSISCDWFLRIDDMFLYLRFILLFCYYPVGRSCAGWSQ